MQKIKTWITGLFKDEKGSPSSKRFIGIVSGLTLCIALLINLFTSYPVDHTLVQSVALLSFGCLGLSSVDKFTKKKDSDDSPQ
jgi:hypothetical protein